MSRKDDLFKNTLVIALGRFSVQFVSFLLLPIYTIFLSPTQYGLVDLIITYVTLIVPIVLLQLDRGAFRFLIDARGDRKATASIVLSSIRLSSLVAAIALTVYAAFAIYFNIPHYLLIAAVVVFTAAQSLLLQISRGLGNNLEYARASLVSAVVLLTTAVILVVVLKLGVSGVLIASAVANVISLIYLIHRLRIVELLRESQVMSMTNEMLRYSLPLIPSNISWWAIGVADRTIVTVVIGLAANGIYAVANKYASIFSAIYTIFDMSWTESASTHIDSKDRDRFFSDVHNTSLKIFGSFALLMVAGMPLVFNLLVGADFAKAYNYFPIIVVAAFAGAIVSQYSVIYIAKKMTVKVLSTSISAAIINIVLNIMFIGRFGLYAAALSTVVAYVVMGAFRIYDTRKYVRIRYEKQTVLGLLAIAVVVFALYYIDNIVMNIVNFLIVSVMSYAINRTIVDGLIDKARKHLIHN